MPSGSDVRVAICVATVGRDPGLPELLTSLEGARLHAPAGSYLLVVADDRPVVDGPVLPAPSPWTAAIEVVDVGGRGIPAARNALVRAALAWGASVVVFVDDDEVVPRHFIDAHLDRLASGASVSTGPVVASYPPSAPAWVVQARPHDRWRGEDHQELPTAATGNTAVRAAVFEQVQPWFDDDYRETGGSDAEYFTRVADSGHLISWNDGVEVAEGVPADRATLSWLVKRTLRTSAHRGAQSRVRGTTGSMVRRAARDLASGAVIVLFGVRPRVVGVLRVVSAGGELLGYGGFRYREYAGQGATPRGSL